MNELLRDAAGWVIVAFLAGLAAMLLWKIWTDRIDLQYLISESSKDHKGDASLSRFQFLIFTFVVAAGLLVVVFHSKALPPVDGSILALLGISGGSYLTSKIAQKGKNGTDSGK